MSTLSDIPEEVFDHPRLESNATAVEVPGLTPEERLWEEESDLRRVLPWWKRPSPWWYAFLPHFDKIMVVDVFFRFIVLNPLLM